ncbi:MAG: GWxTD domain-containing protein [Ignavibacteria bacterium]|nr:GWxTD domain-containing protein [Ignavibacteria bacterium]
MKKLILIIFLISIYLVPGVLHSQKIIMLDADYSIFRYNDSKSVLEIYFAFYHNKFKYKYENNYFNAKAVLGVKLTDEDGKIDILNKEFIMGLKTTDTTSSKLKDKEISQLTFFIEAGKNYSLSLIGSDDKSPLRTDTAYFKFFVPLYNVTDPKISNIELSTSVEKSTNKESNFYKFGLEVVPNPNGLYGNNLKSLYYYFEVYGLKGLKDIPVNLNISVYDINGGKISTKSSSIKDFNDFANMSGSIDVDSLKRGSYLLKVQLAGTDNNIIAESEKKFFLFNNTKTNYIVTDEQGYLKSEFITFTEQQLDDEFEKVLYLRSNIEKNEYEKLKTLDEKRKFIYQFWKRRDNIPETPRLEVRDEFYKRFKEANLKFKQSFMEGWKTDRGRIYIVYGPPNDVEKHYMEANTKNYEIWTYNDVEGGAICVFAETMSTDQGAYFLLHSTLKNELSDTNYKEKLRQM